MNENPYQSPAAPLRSLAKRPTTRISLPAGIVVILIWSVIALILRLWSIGYLH